MALNKAMWCVSLCVWRCTNPNVAALRGGTLVIYPEPESQWGAGGAITGTRIDATRLIATGCGEAGFGMHRNRYIPTTH